MTDMELIQALRCCGKAEEECDCKNCPANTYGCAGAFLRAADRLEALIADNKALEAQCEAHYETERKLAAHISKERRNRQKLTIEKMKLKIECDHFREATKMIGKDTNVPTKWVSVDERSPKRFSQVLLFDAIDEDVFVGELDGNDDWFIAKFEDEPLNRPALRG